MRTARQILTKKSLILLYYILTLSFPPNLRHPKPVITKIFKLQKRAICIINGAKYNSHTESLFKKCKILPLPSLIEYFKIQFMQQYVRGHLPVSFNEVWISQEARRQIENVEYLLRNSKNLYVPL